MTHDASVEMCRFGHYARCSCGWTGDMKRLDQYARAQMKKHLEEKSGKESVQQLREMMK